MTDLNDKVTIIIRSVGERTEQLCRELILAQEVVPANVVTVREAPFSAAMRKSFEIGLERGLPWTFCVDADLLLRPKSIETLLEFAEDSDENICEVQGYILDKFFGGPKEGGVHLYRTSLLPLALSNIPVEGIDIRPEAYMLRAMRAQGYPWLSVPYLVGLHDFEQFYRDIFRKCFVHAHKFYKYADLLLDIWREKASTDVDYHVALQGFAQGITYYEKVLIDTEQKIYQQRFANLQITEKSDLLLNSQSLEYIEQVITNWVEPAAYRRRFPTKMGLIPVPSLSTKEWFIYQMNLLGPVRIIPYTIGSALRHVGMGLQRWVSS